MPTYGPWHEPVDQWVEISDGTIPGTAGIGDNGLSWYGETADKFATAFSGRHDAPHPIAGHQVGGAFPLYDQANPRLNFDLTGLNSYFSGSAAPNTHFQFDPAYPLTVVDPNARLYVYPLTYSGGDTGTVFESGTVGGGHDYDIVGPTNPAGMPAVYGTWTYGASGRVLQSLDVNITGVTSVSTRVWDNYAYTTAATPTITGLVTVTLTIEVHVLSPRWRVVYDITPPLRQYPRDDFLGGAPRQGHANQPKSTQGSARQGWANAYR